MGDGRVMTRDLPAVVHGGVDRAIEMQHSAVTHHVQRLRRTRPAATPADLIAALEKQYLATVTGAGAALGGVAAAPGAGTGVALVSSAGETALFLEATALFTLAVAEVHAVRVEEAERRHAQVLTVVLGDRGTVRIEQQSGRGGGERWGRLLADLIPISTVGSIHTALCHWFVNQQPGSRGARVIGKILPFGIGAVIGAASNHAFGRIVVSATRRVFGPPPLSFTDDDPGAGCDNRRRVPAAVPSPRLAPGADTTPIGRPDAGGDGTEPETSTERPGEATEPETSAQRPEPATSPESSDPPVTGKYRPLYDHLVSQHTHRVETTFSAIDSLVSGGLPKSAFTSRSWWANSAGSRQAKAWLTAGFEVAEVDLGSKTVTFAQRGSES